MIYGTGDTHGSIDIEKLNVKNFPEQRNMTKSDYLFIAGDFGHIWYPEEHKRYKDNKHWLDKYFRETKKFTTLFVDGNHENFELLNSYPVEVWNGGKIHRINDSVIHLMRGQVFNIDGTTFFTFGGARSIDKLHRVPGVSWWAEEEPSMAEMQEGFNNLDKVGWNVDYVITHTCSKKNHNYIMKNIMSLYDDGVYETLNSYFDAIEAKLTYKKWYFGHYHGDFNLNDKTEMLFQRVERVV